MFGSIMDPSPEMIQKKKKSSQSFFLPSHSIFSSTPQSFQTYLILVSLLRQSICLEQFFYQKTLHCWEKLNKSFHRNVVEKLVGMKRRTMVRWRRRQELKGEVAHESRVRIAIGDELAIAEEVKVGLGREG